MYFNVSDRIAHDYPRSEIIEIDRFLARKHLKEFKLQDVRDLPDAADNAQAILDEYTTRRVLKKLNRYYCPKHSDVALETTTLSTIRGKGSCQKCEESYQLLDHDSEVVYQLKTMPESWSNCDDSKSEDLVIHREPPLWRDRRLHIAVIPALVIALVGAAVAFFIHFNSVSAPTPSETVTLTMNAPLETVNATLPSVAIGSATPVATIIPKFLPIPKMTPLS